MGNKQSGVMGYTSERYGLENCNPDGRDYSICDVGAERALYGDGTVRAVRHQPEDWLQTFGSLRRGWLAGPGPAQPSSAPVSATHRRGGGSPGPGRAPAAPDLGAQEAAQGFGGQAWD